MDSSTREAEAVMLTSGQCNFSCGCASGGAIYVRGGRGHEHLAFYTLVCVL
jgi:hypothetical protein